MQRASLGTGLWYDNPKGNYESFFVFSLNTADQENNGGIKEEPQATGDFNTPSSAVTFLDDAQTRHSHRELKYTHFLTFGGQEDSIKGIRRSFTVGHDIGFKSSTYKYDDHLGSSTTLPSAEDSLYYGNFLVDQRGVRYYMEHRKLENAFRLSTYRGRPRANEAPKDLIELALNHQIHWLDFEVADTTVNNLLLSGKLLFNPNERLDIETYAQLGLLGNVGDYRLEGNFNFDFGSIGQLRLEAVNQLNRPTLLQHRLHISQREVWANDFSATLHTTIGGTYFNPKWNLSATGRYHLVNNAIYFNELGNPVQSGTPVSILQLILEKNFTVGRFHLDNVLLFQTSTESFIRLPEIYGKHSLYYYGKWFGVLNVRTGFDVRYNTPYDSYNYLPIIGQFVLQEGQTTEWYPVIDGFFSMRVNSFRAFAKWENLINVARLEDLYYQIANYPHWRNGLRIGVSWRFVN